MNVSRLITGIIMILLGSILIIMNFFLKKNINFILLIYGIPLLIIGIIIFLNKKEDKIEQIKSKGGKK